MKILLSCYEGMSRSDRCLHFWHWRFGPPRQAREVGATGEERQTMFTNAVAAETVIINALATEIATSHREEALAALARINRALAEDEDVIT